MTEEKLSSSAAEEEGASGTRRAITFCRICEASCGLIAEVKHGKVTRLSPDPDHVMSRGFACVKGTRYVDVHASPDRLRTPMKRVDGRFVPVSWEQALAEIGEKVRALRSAHGNESVGVYIGNPAALSPLHILFAGFFTEALDTPHLYTSGSQDCNNKFVAAEEMFGSPLLQPIPDLDRTECMIIIGSNPAISQFTFVNAPRAMERLRERERAGARIFFLNPRKTESARELGTQLFIRPGSDVFFLLAFLAELFERGVESPESRAVADGLDALAQAIKPWSKERVAEITGIAPSELTAVVDAYLAAKGAAIYLGTGVNQGPHGTIAMWITHAIQLLSGNLDRPGGTIVTRTTQRVARYSYPYGAKIVHRYSRFGNYRSVLDSLPAGVLADEILTEGKGQLKGFFVTAGNPILSCPSSERLERAFKELELLVCIDLFRNETGNLAHYLLPATSFLEHGDVPMGMSGFQPEPYAQWVEPVVPPLEQARDEWQIFTDLAQSSGLSLLRSRIAQWWLHRSSAERSKLPRALRFQPHYAAFGSALVHGTTLRKLRKHPHGVKLPPHKPGSFLRRGVLTPNGRVQLAPARFLRALSELDTAGSAQTAQALSLITKRERTSHNSWMHNVERFVSGPRGTNYLYIHPEDAAARSLAEGALCDVRSAIGAVRVPVKFASELARGTVALPHGWGHADADGLRIASRTTGANANLLSADGADALEPLSGMARLTAIEVSVTAYVGSQSEALGP